MLVQLCLEKGIKSLRRSDLQVEPGLVILADVVGVEGLQYIPEDSADGGAIGRHNDAVFATPGGREALDDTSAGVLPVGIGLVQQDR